MARMAASFVDNGYRGSYEFSEPSEYRVSFRGGQYTEYIFAGPDMPEILTAYTWLTGRIAPPPLWSLGLPPMPVVPLHAAGGRSAGRSAPAAPDPVRRPVAGHRIHG